MYRIAVIDDNDSWCFVMGHVLRQYGYAVSTFTEAESFLREVDHFDLALVDFSMPARAFQKAMDGPELICKVKSTLTHPPLLVLLSSYLTDELLAHAADICPEADACLGKHLGLTELVQQIEKILDKKFGTRLQRQTQFSESQIMS